MRAGTTDLNIGTRVRITESGDPDMIGLTGTTTHPFPGLMWPNEKYILGIRLDKKGVSTDDIANLLEGDKFEIIDTGSNNEEDIPRKWEYIADQLKKMKAPSKIIDAATEVDNLLTGLGFDPHTLPWLEDYSNFKETCIDFDLLFSILMEKDYCTACYDCSSICELCKLGGIVRPHVIGCTPRSKYADMYFQMVRGWVEDQIAKENEDDD